VYTLILASRCLNIGAFFSIAGMIMNLKNIFEIIAVSNAEEKPFLRLCYLE